MDSILTSVKKALGIYEDLTAFDEVLIMHINSAFMILRQLGVGPEKGFRINDELTTWDEFTDTTMIESVKTYVTLRVKKDFDPPANSFVLDSMDRTISELEWRLNAEVDR